MIIKTLENKDLKKFIIFCKKNLPKSFNYQPEFLRYWFKDKNKWLVDLVVLNKKIISINLRIKSNALFNNKNHKIIWTSTAFTKLKDNKDANIGLILLNIHRENDIVASVSPNLFSYNLNDTLGYKIKKIALNRFIYVHNLDFLKIVIKNKRKLFNNKDVSQFHKKNKLFSVWTNKIPKDYDELWTEFSKRFKLCGNKNSEFLKKRYLKNPFQKYYLLKILNNKKRLIGFSVIRYQIQKNVKVARIVEFISSKKYEKCNWEEIIYQNSLNNASLSDFFVIGNNQNKNLKFTGFKKMSKNNKYYFIPNLMSPLNQRQWSQSFRISGKKIFKKEVNNLKKIWFTKGDGDRDLPTQYDNKKN
jgi:hypothetical protein